MRAQVAGCLPSKPNVLIHTPVLAKKKEEEEEKRMYNHFYHFLPEVS
jgi:hypothetical protein